MTRTKIENVETKTKGLFTLDTVLVASHIDAWFRRHLGDMQCRTLLH